MQYVIYIMFVYLLALYTNSRYYGTVFCLLVLGFVYDIVLILSIFSVNTLVVVK